MEQLLTFFPKPFIEKLSERSRSSLLRMFDLAARAHKREIRPAHLLTILGTQHGSLASQILRAYRVQFPASDKAGKPDQFSSANPDQRKRVSRKTVLASTRKPLLSPSLVMTLKRATFLAAKYQHTYLGTEHLLGGIIDTIERDTELQRLMNGETAQKIRKHLHELFASSSKLFEIMKMIEEKPGSPPPSAPSKPGETSSSTPALEAFAQDLIRAAHEDQLDPVIGRDRELERLISILVRRTKNNPLLVGDPGVGKTAIVMGLAARIARGNIIPELAERNLYMLDLGLLVAGTTYRGEFEMRLKAVLQEAKDTHAILFIDEFHTIIGAGSAPGSLDAANMLKPALASGELQCIGATTYTEYRRYIEHDTALERRLQPIMVDEPSAETTLAILEGLRPRLETHHRMRIPKEALETAVRLAPLYLPERYFPDRAIDLVDEAASRIRTTLHQDTTANQHMHEMRRKALAFEEKKLRALESQQYDIALETRNLQAKLLEASLSIKAVNEKMWGAHAPTLTTKHIEDLVADATGVPIAALSLEINKRLELIGKTLHTSLIGQSEVVETILASLRRAYTGLRTKHRPLASFLFLGPKGVGKTETARLLSKALFPSDHAKRNAFIKLDMSEYTEAHTISRLIGAPPGYVGFEEGGALTERVRRNPRSLVLFDEIERAHPKVAEILLHILEDGVLTDSQGRSVSFKETIIILTSNLETAKFASAMHLGFRKEAKEGAAPTPATTEDIKQQALKTLRQRLSAETIDRIDRVLVFNTLTPKDIRAITTIYIHEWMRSLTEANLTLTIDAAVLDWLTEKAFEPNEGARRVRRTVEEKLEEPLIEHLSKRLSSRPKTLNATLKKNVIVFNPPRKSRA